MGMGTLELEKLICIGGLSPEGSLSSVMSSNIRFKDSHDLNQGVTVWVAVYRISSPQDSTAQSKMGATALM